MILIAEPKKSEITRAAAFKAVALSTATVEECRQDSEEESAFSPSSQKQWYVKYMDALYKRGWIDKELTPPTEENAEGFLTYAEADYLAGQVSENLKSQVGMTDKNSSKPFPMDEWWKLYESLCKELDVWQEDLVREEVLQVYGTFDRIGS